MGRPITATPDFLTPECPVNELDPYSVVFIVFSAETYWIPENVDCGFLRVLWNFVGSP
jgi:hypothetical protein